jgi:uncharacterized protein YkwD
MRRTLAVSCLLIGCAACVAAAGQGEAKKGKGQQFEPTADEKKLIELTNQERKKHKLPTLKINLVLCKVARDHSANQAKQQKMAHVLDGKNSFQRLKEAKYRYTDCGENVAFGLNVPLEDIMAGWMGSEAHRKNILDSAFTEIGLGAVAAKDGTVYYTQVFGTPRKGN